MQRCIVFLMLVMVISGCQSQSSKPEGDRVVGGPCEGCEAVFEYGNQVLNAVDTLPDFEVTDPKLKVTGTVYKSDGKTAAKDVILYVYQTNREGRYVPKGNEEGWAGRHGHIRGWIKTDQTGEYTFYTFRPGAYPGGTEAEHIHITVKEPNLSPYYIDSVVFDDDPLLTEERRKRLNDRGGSGIATPKMKDGIWMVRRDIVLGMNIPDYE